MASLLKVDKLDPQSGTALEIGTSGDTITVPSGATLDISASTLTPPATMPASSAANLTNIPGANITGTIAAVSGANLTSLTATNLGSGTVPTARLGSGTASSSTILYGDQTYKTEPSGGGKVLQVQNTHFTTGGTVTTSTSFVTTYITDQITPAATSSKILIQMQFRFYPYRETTTANNATGKMALYRDIGGAGFTKVWAASGGADLGIGVSAGTIGGDNAGWMDVQFSQPLIFLDSPNTTSACDYTLYIAKVGTMNNMQVGNSSHVADVVLTEIGA